MAKAQVSVSPVLVEVAQRRVAEAKAADRVPSEATVLIANAQVRSIRETVGTTARVTRGKGPLTRSSVQTKRPR